MTTLKDKLQPILTALKQGLERSGLKARLEPQLARYRAMDAEKKTQVLTGLAFAAVAANFLLVMAPVMTSFFSMNQKIQKVSAEVTLARKDIAAKDQMIKARQAAGEALAKTELRVFKSSETHQFLDVLSALAKESKIKIESLTPVPVKSGPDVLPRPLPKGYSLAGYELLGRAGYHEFGHFIARLESGEAFVRVESIDIYHEMSFDRRSHQVKLRFLIIRRD